MTILAHAEFDDATMKAIANRICEQYEYDGYDNIRLWLWDHIVDDAIPDYFGDLLAKMAEIAVKQGPYSVCDGWHEGDVWRQIDRRIKARYCAIEEAEERRVRRSVGSAER